METGGILASDLQPKNGLGMQVASVPSMVTFEVMYTCGIPCQPCWPQRPWWLSSHVGLKGHGGLAAMLAWKGPSHQPQPAM